MSNKKIKQLITIAKARMAKSSDPVHDLSHVERVAEYVQTLSAPYHLSPSHKQALLLAAWWHDTGRTVINRPSLVLVSFFDDLLSAIMLWWHTIKLGLFGNVSGMATRIIFCHNMGIGTVLMRLLLRPNTRLLLHILNDADNLDTIRVERLQTACRLAEASRFYELGYQLSIWWYGKGGHLFFHTRLAKTFGAQVWQKFTTWVLQPAVINWHQEHFGKSWVEKNLVELQNTKRRFK